MQFDWRIAAIGRLWPALSEQAQKLHMVKLTAQPRTCGTLPGKHDHDVATTAEAALEPEAPCRRDQELDLGPPQIPSHLRIPHGQTQYGGRNG